MFDPQLLPGSISTIFANFAKTQTLTESDRYGLLNALLNEQLNDEERDALDRILYSVRRGWFAIA
ncbi:MAG: hypothetical protein F6J87_19750 [Spirulina sp. SIO3F2]|nr:hypothetical protein [Spirulina sp. SIO3F2]